MRRRRERRTDVSLGERLLTPARAGLTLVRIAAYPDSLARGVKRSHRFDLVTAARKHRRRDGPLDLQLRRGLDRVVLVLRDDPEEVADLHDLDVWEMSDRALIDRDDWSSEPIHGL